MATIFKYKVICIKFRTCCPAYNVTIVTKVKEVWIIIVSPMALTTLIGCIYKLKKSTESKFKNLFVKFTQHG